MGPLVAGTLHQIYQNRPQLTLHKLVKVDEREVDFSDYFPASSRNPDEMFEELRLIIREVGNPHLRALLELIFAGELDGRPDADGIRMTFFGGSERSRQLGSGHGARGGALL